jgi:hypothetical protein
MRLRINASVSWRNHSGFSCDKASWYVLYNQGAMVPCIPS